MAYRYMPYIQQHSGWKIQLIMKEAIHVWGQGIYGKPLYLPLYCVVNLNLL